MSRMRSSETKIDVKVGVLGTVQDSIEVANRSVLRALDTLRDIESRSRPSYSCSLRQENGSPTFHRFKGLNALARFIEQNITMASYNLELFRLAEPIRYSCNLVFLSMDMDRADPLDNCIGVDPQACGSDWEDEFIVEGNFSVGLAGNYASGSNWRKSRSDLIRCFAEHEVSRRLFDALSPGVFRDCGFSYRNMKLCCNWKKNSFLADCVLRDLRLPRGKWKVEIPLKDLAASGELRFVPAGNALLGIM